MAERLSFFIFGTYLHIWQSAPPAAAAHEKLSGNRLAGRGIESEVGVRQRKGSFQKRNCAAVAFVLESKNITGFAEDV